MTSISKMETILKGPSEVVVKFLNDKFKDYQPAHIVILTAGASLITAKIYSELTYKVPWTSRVKKTVFRWVKKLPMVQKQIQEETEKVRVGFEKEMLEPTAEIPDMLTLPQNGMNHDEVLELTKSYLGCGEFDWKQGTFSGTVYNGNEVLTELMTKVYGMAAWTNPLHPDAFPGVRKMEAEIVRMCCDLFNVSNLIRGTNSCGGKFLEANFL